MSTVSRNDGGQPAGSPRAERDQSGEGGATESDACMLATCLFSVLWKAKLTASYTKKKPATGAG
jgi:hypothetical protein